MVMKMAVAWQKWAAVLLVIVGRQQRRSTPGDDGLTTTTELVTAGHDLEWMENDWRGHGRPRTRTDYWQSVMMPFALSTNSSRMV